MTFLSDFYKLLAESFVSAEWMMTHRAVFVIHEGSLKVNFTELLRIVRKLIKKRFWYLKLDFFW
jgi:hypothetical protein